MQAENVAKAHVAMADSMTENVSKTLKQSRVHIDEALKKVRSPSDALCRRAEPRTAAHNPYSDRVPVRPRPPPPAAASYAGTVQSTDLALQHALYYGTQRTQLDGTKQDMEKARRHACRGGGATGGP